MKKMKKIIFILIIAGLCIFIFKQCKKDSCLGTLKFSDEIINSIPYHGGEHLVFRDSLGDSTTFIIENPIYSFIKRTELNNNDYYMIESCVISPINIYFQFNLDPYESPNQIVFRIASFCFNNHSEIKYFFGGEWKYESGKLYQSEPASKITYNDSITIINKTFYSVYDLEGYAYNGDSTEVYSDIYYSIQQGIVGVKTMNGNGKVRRWYLE
jgi:hypothetical protein